MASYDVLHVICPVCNTDLLEKGQGTGTRTIHIELSNGTYSKKPFR